MRRRRCWTTRRWRSWRRRCSPGFPPWSTYIRRTGRGLASLDPGRADEVQARAEAAAADLSRALEAEQEVRRAHDAARDRADRLRDRLADVRAAEESHDRLIEETGPVIRLAALAKGTEGHRRVSLTTYVLRHWFSQVVAAANVRLAAMSSGRYELKRTDEGGTRRERAGLTLAVTDRHTGTDRSPASLSGGETFYTSSALALGLADVVRAEAGGVDLIPSSSTRGSARWTPPPSTEVMAVIDDLRDRGRVVGIVSHVPDLKRPGARAAGGPPPPGRLLGPEGGGLAPGRAAEPTVTLLMAEPTVTLSAGDGHV